MKGQRIRREVERVGDLPGRHAFRAGLHQQAKHREAIAPGRAPREPATACVVFHISTNMELWGGASRIISTIIEMICSGRSRDAMRHLQGRALVIAMCIGQIGNLLPHVVVPAIMAQHLIPLWKLERHAGRPDGERLCDRLHALGAGADRADRSFRCARHSVRRLAGQRPCDSCLRLVRRRIGISDPSLGYRGRGFRRRLHAGPEGADRPASARRRIAQRHALHVELLGRRRTVVPGLAACRRSHRMARRILDHRPRSAAHDRGLPDARSVPATTHGRESARLPPGPAQPHRARLHPRLRRALLRALRHAHLAGVILDLHRGPQRGRRAAWARSHSASS